ncbi:PREDICTED: serine/threonine-protein phosphatase 4 regulatory subunit 2 [Nicrophorus vespilloides]|uniref:Serine/threonine-protein phosphatase 4 regulatory subunit 2 n=1 Tax=Nicrophorus vespilloides TaxID=110193 RepID=A0ABM1M0B7_NICVS|nr:PREDICTED: serine/threonine-protein phosphatase 4 regulatory subunit 2 [Nicrophorus vespilloides]
MENPEEILHSLEEFTKLKPKDIPRELEEYLCFVAKTGDPVYQWAVIKSLFREKLINVITEFYESCPSIDIPPCPNVDLFNYDTMKTFILEKLDTFVAAPFTVQRICELLTTPRKEYNRIDKYMRALEKNILVVSTTEPGNHRTPENGDGFINGIETEHLPDASNEINIEEMDDSPVWPKTETVSFQSTSKNDMAVDNFPAKSSSSDAEAANSETVITCCPIDKTYGAEYVLEAPETIVQDESPAEAEDVSVTITPIPAPVQKRRDSIEPPNEQEPSSAEPKTTETSIVEDKIDESSSEDVVNKSKEESVNMTDNETSSENDTKLASTELLGAGDNLTEDFETVKSLPPEIEETILEPVKNVEEEEMAVSAEVPECKMIEDVPVEADKEEPKIEEVHVVDSAAPEQVVEEDMKLVEEQVQEVVKEEEEKAPEVIETQTEVEEKSLPVQTEEMDHRIEEPPAEKIETREAEKECEEQQQVSLMDVDPEPTTIITEITTPPSPPPPPQQEEPSTTNTASAEIVQTETTN